jgi:hypothetical protein
MTVSSTAARVTYSGNGSTTGFAVNFYFLANSHLKVILLSSSGVETLQVLNTNYTVSGAGNQAGGTVTMLTAPPAGSTLTITRNVPLSQDVDYQPNDPFPAESHEQALDKLTMIAQQQADGNARSLYFPITDSTAISGELPNSTLRASRYLAFDATGKPTVDGALPDEIYLGAKTSDPATRNDGTALQAGDLYFSTTLSAMRVYNGAAWGDVTSGTSFPYQLFSGTGSQTAFTLSSAPGSLGSIEVFVAGVRQRTGTDFTWSGGTTLTFTTAPAAATNNIFVRWLTTQPINVPADGSVTAVKMAAGAAVANIGYTPVNQAGDTMAGALNEAAIVTLASASTVDVGAAAANTINISGTTSITSLGTTAAGAIRRLVFQGALTLTHNGTSLILPGNANITTAAGDVAEFVSLGSGNWRCYSYNRATGTSISSSSFGIPRNIWTFFTGNVSAIAGALTASAPNLAVGHTFTATGTGTATSSGTTMTASAVSAGAFGVGQTVTFPGFSGTYTNSGTTLTIAVASAGALDVNSVVTLNASGITSSQATTVMTVTGITAGGLAVGMGVSGHTGTIASFGTGTGGVGTYNMTTTQTLASAGGRTASGTATISALGTGAGGVGTYTTNRTFSTVAAAAATLSSVPPTRTITALGTGIGGAGTYTLNNGLTAATTAITGSALTYEVTAMSTPTTGTITPAYTIATIAASSQSASWTIPAGVTQAKAYVIGGGGGSGGGGCTNSGGAGGGGTAIALLSGLTPGNTLTVTIGLGGTAGAATPGAGGSGGTTSISSGTQIITTISATGGAGSAGGTGIGAAGGAGSGGILNITGDVGVGTSAQPNGGGTQFAGSTLNNTVGRLYGGGAGGQLSGSTAGFAGAAGAVILEY